MNKILAKHFFNQYKTIMIAKNVLLLLSLAHTSTGGPEGLLSLAGEIKWLLIILMKTKIVCGSYPQREKQPALTHHQVTPIPHTIPPNTAFLSAPPGPSTHSEILDRSNHEGQCIRVRSMSCNLVRRRDSLNGCICICVIRNTGKMDDDTRILSKCLAKSERKKTWEWNPRT